MKEDLYYSTSPSIVLKAEELKSHLTEPEKLLKDFLTTNLPQWNFLSKHPVSDFITNFYCQELELAILLNENTELPDLNKGEILIEKRLKTLGISVLRVDKQEIANDQAGIIDKIMFAIQNRRKESNSVKKPIFEIIPAIDIIDGNCVRLTQGDYSKKTIYYKDPLDIAKKFEDAEISRLHLVDLDGAKAGSVKNWKVLEAIAGKTGLVVDFGGGIKTEKDVAIVMESGAAFATVGSIAVKDETAFISWLQKFGPDKFILGADVKDEKIAVSGWLETTDIWVYDFIEKYINQGVLQIFCTDVSKDGKLEGPSVELYKNIISKFPELHFIASGGVSSLVDVEQLQEIGCKGVIIGKAIYENKISLMDLKQFRY